MAKIQDKIVALNKVEEENEENEEIQKGNSISSLEIKAYYNDENCYWSYSSSNKNAINNNQLIKKCLIPKVWIDKIYL